MKSSIENTTFPVTLESFKKHVMLSYRNSGESGIPRRCEECLDIVGNGSTLNALHQLGLRR